MPCLAQTPAPEPILTTVTITEKISAEAPALVTVLDRPALERIPGVNLDDRLRLVPGFSLFRRTSSLAANPTTQGVSLRGLGSTGASRTLVLWDGIPANSPFGGWVYWTRVAPEEMERVEISRGAPTSVFGDRAMGGAVTLFSAAPERRRLSASYGAGNRGTHQLSGSASHVLANGWGAAASVRALTTDGYFIVPAAARGPIDTRANVRFAGGVARLSHAGARHRLFTRFDAFAEERDNGTEMQWNSTSLGTIAANYARETGTGTFSALAFHSREEYRASFSTIGAGRLTERLSSLQSVPAEGTGAAGFWRKARNRANLVFGGDFHRAEGWSRETVFPAGFRLGGGTQNQGGVFAQSDGAIGPVRMYAGLRGHDTGRSGVFWSPSAGAATGRGAWRVRASGYRAFRAPTLNELYRQFRVGNAVTLANADLRPEALTGVEAGADWRLERTSLSLTAFRNELTDLITNVTLSVTPQLITRMRANAGAAVARGVEAEIRHRFRSLLFDGSWLLADSRFAGGERIPQIARNQGSAQIVWTARRTTVAGGVRANSLQFEDDRNLFALPGFAVWHLTGEQQLVSGLSFRAALENIFNREFSAGFSPTPLIGAPRLWRAGLRWAIR
jgi:outer membrane cobalamin receptor